MDIASNCNHLNFPFLGRLIEVSPIGMNTKITQSKPPWTTFYFHNDSNKNVFPMGLNLLNVQEFCNLKLLKINHLFFCILYGLLFISISMILTSTNKLGKELDVSKAQSFPSMNFLKIGQNLISSSFKLRTKSNSRTSKKDECKVDEEKCFLPRIVNYLSPSCCSSSFTS